MLEVLGVSRVSWYLRLLPLSISLRFAGHPCANDSVLERNFQFGELIGI